MFNYKKATLTNLINGEIVDVHHGENYLHVVSKLPKGLKEVKVKGIIGHSETGHHHVIDGKHKIYEDKNGERYLLIQEVSQLYHQKSFDVHETVTLEPAVYKITHKTEYDPFSKIIREVHD